MTGSAASVTSALDALVFTPTAHQSAAGQTVTTTLTINITDTAGLAATNGVTSIATTETSQSSGGLLGELSIALQLELIYVAYFNRAADGGGDTFWLGQNTQAQRAGQSAAVTLTNIANSFEPQPETIALYPFLGTANLNLNTPAAQTALGTFLNSVYTNMFGRGADAVGQAYWAGQITSGAVGPGAAALAIANGATGTDAITLENKLTGALDFTTRTSAAVLGETSPLPASFITAADTVLKGVDGTSLNDASVTGGINATTTYISGATAGHQTAAVSPPAGLASSTTGSVESNVITITEPGQLVDPGAGSHTIQFLAGANADTLVLHSGGVDQVSGFDPGTDVLDLRSLLAEADINLNGDVAALGNYLTIGDQGADALVRFDPNGQGGGTTVVVLRGSGDVVTGLEPLVAQGAIRIA